MSGVVRYEDETLVEFVIRTADEVLAEQPHPYDCDCGCIDPDTFARNERGW